MSAHHQIGIIVCDHFSPEAREVAGGDVGDLYRRLLGAAEPALGFRDYDARTNELPASFDECDAWIITGSAADAHGDDPWVLALLGWIRGATAKVRMAGVCFGHQAIAQALGGQVERAAGWSVGPQTFELGNTPWFAGRAVTINAMHRDEVTRLPPGVSHVASGTTAATPAFLVGDHTMCVQDHPEFDAALTSYLIRTREDRIGAAVAADGLARSEAVPTDGEVVGRWFVDFLLDRRH